MPNIQTLRPITFGMIFTSRLTGAISTMVLAISEWNDLRTTRRALAKLSDYQLDDIGLSRSDIYTITR